MKLYHIISVQLSSGNASRVALRDAFLMCCVPPATDQYLKELAHVVSFSIISSPLVRLDGHRDGVWETKTFPST